MHAPLTHHTDSLTDEWTWLSQYGEEKEITFPPLTVLIVTGKREMLISGAKIEVYELRPMVSRASEIDAMRISDLVGEDGELVIPEEIANDTTTADKRERMSRIFGKSFGPEHLQSLERTRVCFGRLRHNVGLEQEERGGHVSRRGSGGGGGGGGASEEQVREMQNELNKLRAQFDMMGREMRTLMREGARRYELAVVRRDILDGIADGADRPHSPRPHSPPIPPADEGEQPATHDDTAVTDIWALLPQSAASDGGTLQQLSAGATAPSEAPAKLPPASSVVATTSSLLAALKQEAPLLFDGEKNSSPATHRSSNPKLVPTRPQSARPDAPSPRPSAMSTGSSGTRGQSHPRGRTAAQSAKNSIIDRLERDAVRLGLG